MASFEFRFAPVYVAVGLPFGVTPWTTSVEVEGDDIRVRFGLWTVRTAVANVAGTEVTGPYSLLKTVGPAHLSLADRGITFATNAERGLCVRLHQPVGGIDPLGRIRHPAFTVTVGDVEALAAALSAAAAAGEGVRRRPDGERRWPEGWWPPPAGEASLGSGGGAPALLLDRRVGHLPAVGSK